MAHKVLQFLNVLIKSVLRAQDFKQIGKLPKYFQQNERVDIPAHNLEMWPGYLTQSRLLADGIFLNVDTAARFIQKSSILDWINARMKDGWDKKRIAAEFDSSNTDKSRKTVITTYNIKSYQVDGLDWNQNPQTHTFVKKKGGKEYTCSMAQHIEEDYKIKLKFPQQPLLYVNFRDRRLYFPTECCREASLPENFTSDSRKMKDLQEFKIGDPNKRMQRVCDVINKLLQAGEFKQFDIQLKNEEHKVVGYVHNPPTLVANKGTASWDQYTARKIPHA